MTTAAPMITAAQRGRDIPVAAIPRTSPFALEPSAATTLIGRIPFGLNAAKTASRLSASIAASCRTPSLVIICVSEYHAHENYRM